MISLKQLRYFDAVARAGHMGRAAERCSVTQPALSMQIQELERSLGVALLERLPRGVRLTEPGREIAARARRVLLEVEDLAAYARSCEGGRGALRLGVIPTIAPYLLPQTLSRWRGALPSLEPQIRESQTQSLLDALVEGELDLILAALPIEHAETDSLALFEDRFLLATPADAPEGRSDEAGTAEDQLRRARLLLLEEGHCLRDQTLAAWPLADGAEVSRFGASSLSTLMQMVAEGLGVTVIPEMSVAVESRGRAVRLRRFAAPEPRRRIGLVWRKRSPRRREFEAVAALLRELAPAPALRPATA